MSSASLEERRLPRPRTYLAGRPDRPDLVGKALRSSADAIFLDFEDAVPAAARATAREALIEVLGEAPLTKPVLVRCNRLDHPDGPLDLEAAVRAGSRSVIFPKTRDPEEIVTAEKAIAQVEATLDLAAGTVGLWVMVETAAAVDNLDAILRASSGIEGVFLGPGDLSLDLGVPMIDGDRVQLDHPILRWCHMRVAVTARAHGVRQIMTAAYERNQDLDEVRDCSLRAFGMGYTAVEIQSPRHVDVVHEAHRPTAETLQHAKAVVVAYEGAVAAGEGLVIVGDQGVQRPGYEAALDTLAKQRTA